MAISKRGKIGWGSIAILAGVLLFLLGSCNSDCDDQSKEPASAPHATATATVTATPSPPGSQIGALVDTARSLVQQTGLLVAFHDASDNNAAPSGDWTICFEKATLSKVDFAAVPNGAPCPKKDGRPIPWPKMPNITGTTYAEAVDRLNDVAGDVDIAAAYLDESASDTDNLSGGYAKWKVCFQSVKAGTALVGAPEVTLHAVGEGAGCPSSTGTYKDPTNDPAYVAPDVGQPEDDDNSSSTGGSGSSDDYDPGDKGGCPPGGCYNPCPPGGCH